ncbi:hypothetical protein QF035_009106 [Streptomyces umbrinus]|uniref:Uncharacterized protein n=1 Tax=Streptomyces umbrinus TaxID=67370 RepID=A0ABU0T9Q7_9ACTN|nr:hypothetical protein [Streptomyces umbrinus]MDQ1031524.1 hypothetical protein [Streptomyces umbrinus]
MREDIAGVPSPDEASQDVTIEEVLAQLDRVGRKAPGGEFDFDEKGLARLHAWMEAEDPAEGDSTGPGDLTPE